MKAPFSCYQIGKIHYQRPPLALLSPAISVFEPRFTDDGLYLIPALVCEASIPLLDADPYFLSCSALCRASSLRFAFCVGEDSNLVS